MATASAVVADVAASPPGVRWATRPAGRASGEMREVADAAPRGRLLHPARRADRIGAAAAVAQRVAGARHRWKASSAPPGRATAWFPWSWSPSPPPRAGVREALAAVVADERIAEKPQVERD